MGYLDKNAYLCGEFSNLRRLNDFADACRQVGSAVFLVYGLIGLKGLAAHIKAGRGGMSLRVLSLRFLGSAVFLVYGLRGLKGLATHIKAGRGGISTDS